MGRAIAKPTIHQYDNHFINHKVVVGFHFVPTHPTFTDHQKIQLVGNPLRRITGFPLQCLNQNCQNIRVEPKVFSLKKTLGSTKVFLQKTFASNRIVRIFKNDCIDFKQGLKYY